MALSQGWRAVLEDADTHLDPGGPLSIEEARATALAYLEARLDRLGPHDPPTRRAGLQLALGRIRQIREIS